MVSTKLNQNHITLVPYGEKYLDATFRWINDPRVSVPFLFNRKVSKKDHLFWYNSIGMILLSSYLLFTIKQEPI